MKFFWTFSNYIFCVYIIAYESIRNWLQNHAKWWGYPQRFIWVEWRPSLFLWLFETKMKEYNCHLTIFRNGTFITESSTVIKIGNHFDINEIDYISGFQDFRLVQKTFIPQIREWIIWHYTSPYHLQISRLKFQEIIFAIYEDNIDYPI